MSIYIYIISVCLKDPKANGDLGTRCFGILRSQRIQFIEILPLHIFTSHLRISQKSKHTQQYLKIWRIFLQSVPNKPKNPKMLALQDQPSPTDGTGASDDGADGASSPEATT